MINRVARGNRGQGFSVISIAGRGRSAYVKLRGRRNDSLSGTAGCHPEAEAISPAGARACLFSGDRNERVRLESDGCHVIVADARRRGGAADVNVRQVRPT